VSDPFPAPKLVSKVWIHMALYCPTTSDVLVAREEKCFKVDSRGKAVTEQCLAEYFTWQYSP